MATCLLKRNLTPTRESTKASGWTWIYWHFASRSASTDDNKSHFGIQATVLRSVIGNSDFNDFRKTVKWNDCRRQSLRAYSEFIKFYRCFRCCNREAVHLLHPLRWSNYRQLDFIKFKSITWSAQVITLRSARDGMSSIKINILPKNLSKEDRISRQELAGRNVPCYRFYSPSGNGRNCWSSGGRTGGWALAKLIWTRKLHFSGSTWSSGAIG